MKMIIFMKDESFSGNIRNFKYKSLNMETPIGGDFVYSEKIYYYDTKLDKIRFYNAEDHYELYVKKNDIFVSLFTVSKNEDKIMNMAIDTFDEIWNSIWDRINNLIENPINNEKSKINLNNKIKLEKDKNKNEHDEYIKKQKEMERNYLNSIAYKVLFGGNVNGSDLMDLASKLNIKIHSRTKGNIKKKKYYFTEDIKFFIIYGGKKVKNEFDIIKNIHDEIIKQDFIKKV